MIETIVTRRGQMTRSALRPLGAIALAGVLATAVSCDSPDGFTGLREDPQDLFWGLALNQHAVNLSTDQSRPEYFTYQLVATPYRLDGSVIEGEHEIEWTTSDTMKVKVDADGLLTARATTSLKAPVRIIARMTGGAGPVTNADTAFVSVTSTVRTAESLSIQPYRTTIGVGYDTTMAATVLDDLGNPIGGLRIAYESSLPKVVGYTAAGVMMPMTMGTATISASAAVYGAELEDEVTLTIGEPEVLHVNIGFFRRADGEVDTYFDPVEITIKAGQGVSWGSNNAIAATIVFEDPTNVGPSPVDGKSGNLGFIIPIPPNRFLRTFDVPGTYEYRDAATGKTATGRIIVTP